MNRLNNTIRHLYRITSFKSLRGKPVGDFIFKGSEALKKMFALKYLDCNVGSFLKEKYSDIDINKLNAIGNKVWMLWYTGFDTAPLLVKKCIEKVKSIEGIELVLLDKSNLREYIQFPSHIERLLKLGNIPIQIFSDIIRFNLLSKYGGIWCDATVYITHNDFLPKLSDRKFYSAKYTPNWLFTEGKWTSFFVASGKENPLVCAQLDAFYEYFKHQSNQFCYLQIDYNYLYLYNKFHWAKAMIDSVDQDNKDIFYLSYNWDKPYNEAEYNKVMQENEIQKLNWKSNKVPDISSAEETNGIHFLS